MNKRNPIARANWLVNKPKIVKPKKGKGSYQRKGKKKSSLIFCSDSVQKEIWCKAVKAATTI